MDQLRDLLENHRDELHALSGVVGTGIGYANMPDPSGDIVIQIFVRSPDHSENVLRAARAILGEAPVTVIVTGEATPGGD